MEKKQKSLGDEIRGMGKEVKYQEEYQEERNQEYPGRSIQVGVPRQESIQAREVRIMENEKGMVHMEERMGFVGKE